MIIELDKDAWAEAEAIPEPKLIWWDITRIVVYTGEDVPVPSAE